jgi:hypothetical protein
MFKRFTAGFGVGYVLGARAGQKRYEQITELAERAMEVPFVSQMVESGRGRAMESGRRVFETIKDRALFQQPSSSDEEESDEDEEGQEDYEEPASDSEARAEDYEEDDEGDGAEDFEADAEEGAEPENEDEDAEEEPKRRPAARSSANGSSRSRARNGIGAIAAAALDRGRVD